MLRRVLKHGYLWLFRAAERAGIHLLPRHYYSPVADRHWLQAHRALWQEPLPLHGIAWDLEAQMAWLREKCASYYQEVQGLASYRRITEGGIGPGYGAIEAQVLHCVMRSMNPPRVVEIGSGVSTAIMAEASAANAQERGRGSEIIAIEPYPRPPLRALAGVRLEPSLVQEVSADVFAELKAGDLLFIDSSHAVKTGSDVHRIYLEILPRLAPGVLIHIHDIFLPYAYPRDLMTASWDWQETALLSALLTHNPRFRVLSCLSALHYARPAELSALLTDYVPQGNVHGLPSGDTAGREFPASLWLETVGEK